MNPIINYATLLEKKRERDRVREVLTEKPTLEQYMEAVAVNMEASNDTIEKQNELIAAMKDMIESQDELIKLYEHYIVLLGGKTPTAR